MVLEVKRKERESLGRTCVRELKEETGLQCTILRQLSTMELSKDPKTGKEADIKLYHYRCRLKVKPKNYDSFEYKRHGVFWLGLDEIKNGAYDVAPNIKFLLERGELK